MRKFRVVAAAMLAACMCICACACGSGTESVDIEDKINNMDEDDIADAIEDYVSDADVSTTEKTEPVQSEPTDTSVTEPVQTEPAVYTVSPDPSEEIVNAEFSSGLVQMDNFVFQTGCYITADELVAQFADTHDAVYMKGYADTEGAYEDRKDYLVKYEERPWENNVPRYKYESYFITFTPKEGTVGREFKAFVVNMTNPDEKITLDKAQVYSCEFIPKRNQINPEYLEWVPMGFGGNNYSINGEVPEQNTMNETCSRSDFINGLNENGYVESYYVGEKSYKSAGEDCFIVCVYGEKNLAGLYPVFSYSFRFDPNTDKLESVSFSLSCMMEE